MVVIRKDIYSNLEFEEEQAAHQKKVAAMLNAERSEIVNFLLKTNEFFRRDGPDVSHFVDPYFCSTAFLSVALKTNGEKFILKIVMTMS